MPTLVTRILQTSVVHDVMGSSIIIENYARQLRRLGYEVDICAARFHRWITKPENMDFVRLYSILEIVPLLDDFDIIHSHDTLTTYLSLTSGSSIVYHYHGTPSLGFGSSIRSAHLRLFAQTVGRRLDRVIAVSETAAQDLAGFGLTKGVDVIYSGADTSIFRPGLEERHRFGSPQLIFVGRFYRYKRLEELIKGLRLLLPLYPQASLCLVGQGEELPGLKALINRLELQTHVRLEGYVSHLELPYYYASSDLCVTSSVCEAGPLPLFEAMSCGLPIVVSAIRSHTEIATKSGAGRSYSIGDVESFGRAVVDALESKKNLSRNAIDFAVSHSCQNAAKRIDEIYKEVLSVGR